MRTPVFAYCARLAHLRQQRLVPPLQDDVELLPHAVPGSMLYTANANTTPILLVRS
jgi:hypothetical protein